MEVLMEIILLRRRIIEKFIFIYLLSLDSVKHLKHGRRKEIRGGYQVKRKTILWWSLSTQRNCELIVTICSYNKSSESWGFCWVFIKKSIMWSRTVQTDRLIHTVNRLWTRSDWEPTESLRYLCELSPADSLQTSVQPLREQRGVKMDRGGGLADILAKHLHIQKQSGGRVCSQIWYYNVGKVWWYFGQKTQKVTKMILRSATKPTGPQNRSFSVGFNSLYLLILISFPWKDFFGNFISLLPA